MTKLPHAKNSLPPTFAELGVAAEIVDALAQQGIERTFAIQELTLPIALDGKDLIGQARTGMGKTLGFGVPLLDRVFDDAALAELDGSPRALVVAPTRELAQQVSGDLKAAATFLTAPASGSKSGTSRRPLAVTTILGGHSMDDQLAELKRGSDVLVGTPGRLLDLYQRNELDLSKVGIVVLDEADEMLDLGFLPDIESLLSALPDNRQTMLFSATMPGPILTLARAMMNRPVHIRAEGADTQSTHKNTKQIAFKSHHMDKAATVARILQAEGRGRTIIFTRTKRAAAQLTQDLADRGFLVGAVHGDMNQASREKSMDAFRNNKVEILVATDVAARGIDVDDVTHVINYHLPDDEMTYVHRIGRTGRAGHSGVAVTLVGWDEAIKWSVINNALNLGIDELPEWFSTNPELHEALNIAPDAQDRVGPARPPFGGAHTLKPAQAGRGRSDRHGSRSGSHSGGGNRNGGRPRNHGSRTRR